MENVRIVRKELANGLSAVLVYLGEQGGMTLPEVVKVFGIPRQTIETHMKTNGFEYCRISGTNRKQLQEQNVIPLRGQPPRIVSQEAIESLVRFISTPETDAICNQLWDVAKAVQKGDIEAAAAHVVAAADLPQFLLTNLRDAVGLAERMMKERDEERAKRLTAEKRSFTSMALAGRLTLLTRKMDKEIGCLGEKLLLKDRTIAELAGKVAAVSGNEWATSAEWARTYPPLKSLHPVALTARLKAVAKRIGQPVMDKQITWYKGERANTGTVKMFNRCTVVAYLSENRG